MRMRQKRLWLVMLIAIALGVQDHAQDERFRDGNWWRTIDTLSKDAYLVGFFDGLILGSQFSWWHILGKNGKLDNSEADKARDSFDSVRNHLKT